MGSALLAAEKEEDFCGMFRGTSARPPAPQLPVCQASKVCHYPSWELTQKGKLSPALDPAQSSGNMSSGQIKSPQTTQLYMGRILLLISF